MSIEEGNDIIIKAKVINLPDGETIELSIQAADIPKVESSGNMVTFVIERKQHPEIARLN